MSENLDRNDRLFSQGLKNTLDAHDRAEKVKIERERNQAKLTERILADYNDNNRITKKTYRNSRKGIWIAIVAILLTGSGLLIQLLQYYKLWPFGLKH